MSKNSKKYTGERFSTEYKIKIIEEYYEQGNKVLEGKTVYKGYPIGIWAINIRSNVKTKRINLTPEQIERLDKLDLLEEQVEASIDKKIQELVKWNKKYPDVLIGKEKTLVNLYKYSKYKNKREKILKEYEKMMRYYEYVSHRKSEGKLTKEQIDKCEEGNIRGVFGYPRKTEELAKKYRITESKIDYILIKYESMENFILAYRNGDLTEEDLAVLNKNLRKSLDINFNNNSEYEKLFFEFNSKPKYISEKNINIYSSNSIKKSIERLDDKYKTVLQGVIESSAQSEMAKEKSVSRQYISQLKEKALIKIKHMKNDIIPKWSKPDDSLSKEEKEKYSQLIDVIFSSNIIFYPDKKYLYEEMNLDTEKFYELIGDLDYLTKSKENLPENIAIDDLEFQPRIRNALKRTNINTVHDLINFTKSDLLKIRNLGDSLVEEIVDKITVLGFSLKEEIIEKKEELELNQKNYKDILLEEMNFSLRTYSILKRAGIGSSGELAYFTKEELLKVKNLGQRALKEILEKMNTLEITEEEEIADDGEKEKTVVNIAIEDLGLTPRLNNFFKRLNINTTKDLSKYTVEELLNMKGIGRQTVSELVDTLGKFGVSLASPKENIEETIEVEDEEEIRKMSNLEKLKNKKRAMEDSIKGMENALNEAKALLEHYNRLIRNIEQKEDSQFREFEE